MSLLNNKASLIGVQECLDALDEALEAAASKPFVASEETDWDDDTSPATLQEALDQLAARVKVLEP